jgi:hypothetical protein
MREKRSSPRFDVVAYYKLSELNPDQDSGRVTDISTEGMRVQGREPIEVNQNRRFEMTVPKTGSMGGNVLFNADVIWCQESTTPGMFESGIHLTSISAADSNNLQEIIENMPIERRQIQMHRREPGEY